MKSMKILRTLGIVIAAAAMLAVGCSDNGNSNNAFANNNSNNNNNGGPMAPAGAQTQTYVQVEQLARPAIAEGLLYTNANLALYNSVGPDFVSRGLTNASGPEHAALFSPTGPGTEALGTLTLLATVGGGNVTQANAFAGVFLPDVLRIDTSLSFVPIAGTEVQAYATFNTAGSNLCGGRKLTDDVIDDTIYTLTLKAVPGDNVGYYPVAGNNAVGHSFLNGQTVKYGPSTFPFLAPAQ